MTTVGGARPVAGHERTTLPGTELDAAVGEAAGADLRARAGRRARRSAGRRRRRPRAPVASRSRWSSSGPWLRLRRTTSTPARSSASSRAGSSLAGPIVATIFVRRVTSLSSRRRGRAAAAGPSWRRWPAARPPSTRPPPLRAFLDASPSPWHAVARRRPGCSARPVRRGRRAGAVGRRPGRRLRRRAAAPSSPGAGRPAAGRCRSASSAPTPTRPTCASSPTPTATAPAGASSASRSTAACCSTAGSTATSASPGGSCSPTAATPLVAVDEPIARVPQLAIHLDRDVNERGLVLDRQAHMSPVWATELGTTFAQWIAERAGTSVAGGVGAVPVRRAAGRRARRRPLAARQRPPRQPGVVLGRDDRAGRRRSRTDHVAMIALFDHEEVGSASTTGRVGAVPRDRPRAAQRRPPAADATTCTAPLAGVELRVGRQRPRRAPELPRAPRPRPRARSSTTARRSSSTPTSATRRRPTRPCCSSRRAPTPACRTRCSSRATTCRAARRSAR